MEPNPNNLKRIADDFTVSPFVKPHSYSIPISNSIIKQTHHHKIYYLFTTHFHPIFWTYNVFGANVALWECPKVILKKYIYIKKKKKFQTNPSFLFASDTRIMVVQVSISLRVTQHDATTTILKEWQLLCSCPHPSLLGSTHFYLIHLLYVTAPSWRKLWSVWSVTTHLKQNYIYIMTCMDWSGGTNFYFYFYFYFSFLNVSLYTLCVI